MPPAKDKKRVQHKGSTVTEAVSDRLSTISNEGSHASKGTFFANYVNKIKLDIIFRNSMKILEKQNGSERDVTPAYLEPKALQLEKLTKLGVKDVLPVVVDLASRSTQSLTQSRFGAFRVSMDDIINGIACHNLPGRDSRSAPEQKMSIFSEYDKSFISVRLGISEEFHLYEQISSTVLKESTEAAHVQEDNKIYDYLTIGKGRVRRISEHEAQTYEVLLKTRSTNTLPVSTVEKGTFVSYYDMYETYRELALLKSTIIAIAEEEVVRKKTAEDMANEIVSMESFKLALMITCRTLAGNILQCGQRRFRNMPPKRIVEKQNFIKYSLDLLFRFQALPQAKSERKAVADMSFCCKNSDILAVGYGIYSFGTSNVPSSGYACIWNIKNPINPERTYHFVCAVVTVEFSPFVPSLLAIGLYNGDIQIFDISNRNSPPISVADRQLSSVEAILSIKWLATKDSDDPQEIEPLLGLSQDGSIRKYRMNSSPFLSAYTIMTMDRLEGTLEGLLVKRDPIVISSTVHANRHPKGMSLTIHPLEPDIYYVCTDEGCLVKCSTNYAHQYIIVLRTHDSTVKNMDFSPWSPKLFVTCGDDWYIRIWMVGILKPLITLSNCLAAVHCVYWSRTHSTMLLAMNRATFDIWDIRRDLLRPMSSTEVDSSYFSTFKISNCGKSVVIGNNRGDALVCALNDMPKPPHFQYEDLEKAILKAVNTDTDLLNEVKSVGYFGFPKPAET